MRIVATDICTRKILTKLLVKIEQNPESSRKIGLQDASRFRIENAGTEKEVKENAELIRAYADGDRII